MPSRRLSVVTRPVLLVVLGIIATRFSHVRADEAILEAAPKSAVADIDNADEPKVDLKERAPSAFRTVSRSRRAKTNDRLVELVKETVDVTSRRMLSTEQHSPWQMIHALLGLRNEWSILHEGSPVSGLDWIAQGQTYENEYWFEKTEFGGRAHPYSRPYAFEGHANQTIALISMCGVGLEREFGTAGGTVTMRDMIRHAQMTVTARDEPTWTLWVLSRYLPPSAQWRNKDGEYWSIERLVKNQVDKPMKGAPCGGTHGLFALAHARNVYLQQGNQLRGVWLEADYKIRKYINTARVLQNRDGSLSSNYFRGREFNPDFNKRMASVGHTLEFLMIALPQKDLNQPWVRRAIESAARELMANRRAYVKCSPLYHTVNALNIYLDRVNPAKPTEIAEKPGRKTVRRDTPKTKSSGVPVQTVSRPRPVPETTDAHQLQPVPEVPADAPQAGKAESVEGEWKATPEDRRGPLSVPADKTGGAPATEPEMTPIYETATPPVSDPLADESAAAADEVPEAVPAEAEPAADSADPVAAAASETVEEPAETPAEAPAGAAAAVTGDSPAEQSPVTEPATEPVKKSAAASTTEASMDTSSETPTPETTAETVSETAPEPAAKAPPATALVIPETVPSAEPETATDASVPTAAETPEVLELTTEAVDGLKPMPTPLTGKEESSLEDYVAAWEHPERAAIRVQAAIVDALDLRTGDAVADLGSGTGVFLKPLAEKVGSEGRVYAIETSAMLVDHIEVRVEQDGLSGVYVVRNDAESLQLTYHRVDRILMVDTWQHLENPGAILLSAQTALVPGGQMLIVDADGNLDSHARERLLKLAGESGLVYIEDVPVDGLEHGQVIRLQRPF